MRRSRPRMLGPAITACFVAAVAVLPGAPALAQDGVNPVDDFLSAIGAQVSEANGVVRIDDAEGDGFGSTGQKPADGAGYFDMMAAWLVSISDSPEETEKALYDCSGPNRTCASADVGSDRFASGGLLAAVQVDGTLDQFKSDGRRCGIGVIGRDPRFPAAEATTERPFRFLEGGSHVWEYGFNAESDVHLGVINSGGTFNQYNTQARVYTWPVDGPADTVLIYIPNGGNEAAGLGSVDFFTSCGPPPGQQGDSFADTLTDRPLGTSGFTTAIPEPVQVVKAAPKPEPEPVSPPPVEPAPKPEPEPVSPPPVQPEPAPTAPSETPMALFVALLAGGLVALALAVWFLFLRGRGAKGEPEPGSPEAPPPPGSTPAPPDEPSPPAPPGEPVPTPPDEPPSTPPPPPPPPGGGGPVVDGGSPGPGPIPPPPPPPPPPPCVDGEEEWRDDKPGATFTIPDPSGRVSIAADPTTPELEAWIESFGTPRGVPCPEFLTLEEEQRDALLAGLPGGPTEYHWSILLPLQELRLQCQRKWICTDGAWAPTGQTRVLESANEAVARFTIDGPGITASQVRDKWQDAVDALKAADGNVQAADAFRRDCV